MDQSALTHKIEHALLDLGESPETVAAYLEAQGIRGERFRAAHCPVAKFLLQACGLWFVSVGARHGDAKLTDEEIGLTPFEVPGPVRDFIAAFDDRQYPALEVGDGRD